MTNNLVKQLPSHLGLGLAGWILASSVYATEYVKVKNVAENDVLNIRAEASASTDIIGSIPANEQCIVTTGCENKWCQVNYNGINGWIAKNYTQVQNCQLLPTKQMQHASLLDIPVTSSLPILKAVGQLAEQNQSAVDLSLKIVGAFEEASKQIIYQHNDSPESADKTTITIIRDGYLDDSVRGERWDIKLQKQSYGKWQTISVTVASRCWPGRGHEDYSKALCK